MSLLIVGVGHVFRIEESLRALIERERPQVVALELDRDRFEGLRQRQMGIKESPEARKQAGRIYRYMARFQEDVAGSLGTQVGSEMLAAAQAAQAVGARIALIDRDAREAVARLSSEMSLRERLRLLGSLLLAKLPLRRGPSVEEEIERYQKDPAAYLRVVEKHYPTVTRVLIHERNEHMAAKLRELDRGGASVVAIVGDGHVEGMTKTLADLRPRVVRLRELRAPAAPGVGWTSSPGGDRVGFSFLQESREGSFERRP